jgi:DNA-directed RNA polymerase I, II, and III subunit RPABC1
VHFHRTKFDKSRDGTIGFFKRILKIKRQDSLVIVFTRDNMPSNPELYEENSPLIQLYDARRLVVNITKHRLVPKHRILSLGEAAEVRARYNVSDTKQFPVINTSDPVARFLGARLGDLMEIKRADNFSGEHLNYRIVSFPQK